MAVTLARANRVYPGKTEGVIVDYNGMLKSLRKALAQYALGDDDGEPGSGGGGDGIVGAERVDIVLQLIAQGEPCSLGPVCWRWSFPAWASAEPASRLRNFHPQRPAKAANKPEEIVACQARPRLIRFAQDECEREPILPHPRSVGTSGRANNQIHISCSSCPTHPARQSLRTTS